MIISREGYKRYDKKIRVYNPETKEFDQKIVGKFKIVGKYTHNTDTQKTHYEGKASVNRTEQKQMYENLLQDIDDYYNQEWQTFIQEFANEVNNKRGEK